MSLQYYHHIIRFDPSGSPVAVSDAGTIHAIGYLGALKNKKFRISSIQASLRCLQAEKPAVMGEYGLFLAKTPIGDLGSSKTDIWNLAADTEFPNSTQKSVSDIFFAYMFKTMPENSSIQFCVPEVDFSEYQPFYASLVIENLDTVNTYAKVIRCHLTFGLEVIS